MVGHKVTHVILPARNDAEPQEAPHPTQTPDALAKELLDEITPSTNVSVTTPAYVADRAVYELVLAPLSADSTIDHVGISVDAANGMPLQVQLVPKGQSKPAVELGFTSIDYGRPGGSFSFTPPPGATVATKDLTKEDHHDSALPADVGSTDTYYLVPRGLPQTGPDRAAHVGNTTVVGEDWTSVVIARDVQLPMRGWGLREATTRVSGPFGEGRLRSAGSRPVTGAVVGRRIAVGLRLAEPLEGGKTVGLGGHRFAAAPNSGRQGLPA